MWIKKFAAVFTAALASVSAVPVYAAEGQGAGDKEALEVDESKAAAINSAEFVQYLNVPIRSGSTALTLEEAIEKALANSTQLKNSGMSITLSEEQAESAQQSYSNAESGSTLNALLTMIKQNSSYNNALKDKEALEQKIAYQMKELYVQIINAERKLALSEENIAVSEKELNISKVKLELGLMAQADYEQAELSLKKSREDIEKSRTALDETYRSLNILIGSDENNRYMLVLNPEYSELELDMDIETYAHAYSTAPLSIRQKKENIQLAEQSRAVESANVVNSTKASDISAKNAVAQAELEYKDAVTEFKSAIISSYTAIKETEQSCQTGLDELKALKKQLIISQTKYESGDITQIELERAQYNIAAKESELLELMYSHMLAVEKFNNVDLLAG